MAKVPRRTIFRPLALMMAMALAIGWTAWPALAQDSSESAEAATEGSKIALIMDASDSMSEEDVDGGTRLDAAKRASQQLVDSMPETAQLGMLAYGASESNAPDNRERDLMRRITGSVAVRTLMCWPQLSASIKKN